VATLEQDRARFALERIDPLKNRSAGDQAKFKSQLLKLPARLHTSGLGQTVAFYLAAGAESPEAEICAWLGTWLATRLNLGDRPLLECITGTVPPPTEAETIYRKASAEARALAVWLKRFAEAFLSERLPAPHAAGAEDQEAGATGTVAEGGGSR
jgi:CRISPR/Cas system CMR-associated protein Cmr5 small subunit